MGLKDKSNFSVRGVVEGLSNVVAQKPLAMGLIPLILVLWSVEKWIFSFSAWVPLVLAVWATLQYGQHQQHLLVEQLDRKWKRILQNSLPVTPLEQCQWLNRLSVEVWPNYMNPKLSTKFSSIVEKRLRNKKSRLIESVKLQEFSLGSEPPSLGLQGAYWSTTGDQKIMHLGFDWDTNEMSVLLVAKLGKPFKGTVGIVVNSLHIKGDLLLMPVLEGKAVLYSFVATPEVKIGVAFGSGSQSLPATELPGVSSWLVKILTETLVKTMVEPRRRCFSLPTFDLKKRVSCGIIYVTVVLASKLPCSSSKRSPSRKRSLNGTSEEFHDDEEANMFVEIELEDLTRRTDMRSGSSPRWDSIFNMLLHDDTGTVRFNLYQCTQNSVNYKYLSSCEVKMKYGADDSIMFWAIGNESSILARHGKRGTEVEMVVPFEGVDAGELKVRLVLKEWQFGEGSPARSPNFHASSSRQSLNSLSSLPYKTGRKIRITIVEGKDIIARDKSGKTGAYVKLRYGKVLQRTNTAQNNSNPIWDQTLEFDEIADGGYLKIKCFNEDTFSDDNIGTARVDLEGLVEGTMRDVWLPLEKVKSGEIRMQIEVSTQNHTSSSGSGWIELVVIEGRDLAAVHMRGTSDPYVRVQYGNCKKRTKVLYKTLNPKWNQTFEFPDDGSSLELHVKDHNALLPTSNIGDCVVEYQRYPPNEMIDEWIPLQGVKKGEIRVQITRKLPLLDKKSSVDSDSSFTKAHQISSQMKQMIIELQSVIGEGNSETLTTQLSELESLQNMQEEYMSQLETEQVLLLNKIKEFSQEFFNASPSPPHPPSSPLRTFGTREDLPVQLHRETLHRKKNSLSSSDVLSSEVVAKISVTRKLRQRISHRLSSSNIDDV
ncbi:unnamed protein product [Rhodiola kirilowii]